MRWRLIMRLARAFDQAASDPREAAFARLVTPAAKYWICKTAPSFIYEAMECLGGNGYVEESILPRLYREAPVNAIWEGSGNVMCLDVLRALRRDEEAAEFFADLARKSALLVGAASDLFAPMNDFESEAKARITVGKLATLAAASALEATAPPAVTEAFVRTRLAPAARRALRRRRYRGAHRRHAAAARAAGGVSRWSSCEPPSASGSSTRYGGLEELARSGARPPTEARLPRLSRQDASEPIQRALQDVGGGMLIDHGLALVAADVRLDQGAFDRGGREPLVPERDWKLGQLRQIAGESTRRLRARTFAAVHVDRKPEHIARDAPLAGEREQARGIIAEAFPGDRLDRSGQTAVGIAHGNTDGLGAEIETHQCAARRQERCGLGQ